MGVLDHNDCDHHRADGDGDAASDMMFDVEES